MARSLEQFAVEVVQQLRAAGYEALWAGGCVRDRLLGVAPKDFDVATSAPPDAIREVFGKRRTLAIGAAFGVITVLGRGSGEQIEVATFRADIGYSDGRRPDAVRFTSAEEDAKRRDFTINGLFFDPMTNEVIDFVAGQVDLGRRLIRAIGDPAARFSEDKLRMLRAIRFATTLDFDIDPATFAAIPPRAGELAQVSAERIGAELRRLLVAPARQRGVELLEASGVAAIAMPEFHALSSEQRAAGRAALGQLPSPTPALALAALVHSGGDGEVASQLAQRLRFTRHEWQDARWWIDELPAIAQATDAPWPRVQRLLVDRRGAALVDLASAIFGAEAPAIRFCRERLAWPIAVLNPAPLLTGDAIVASGVRPGPGFAVLLDAVRDAQLTGEITTPAEALALAQRLRDNAAIDESGAAP